MNKSIYIFLAIITFGLFPFFINKKAKIKATEVNTKLYSSNLVNFDIKNFIIDLGGKKNIKDVSATISTVKITVINKVEIYSKFKTKYKIKGIINNFNNIILVFGDSAKEIERQIKEQLIN